MSDESDSLQDALRALNLMFAQKLPSKLLEIEEALNQFSAHPANADALALLHRLLHTMSGSAGTFGFDELGAHSRKLEVRIKTLMNGAVWTEVQLQQFISDVRVYLVTAVPGAEPVVLPSLPDKPVHLEVKASTSPLIYLVDSDTVLTDAISVQLRQFGYEILALNSISDLSEALLSRMPELIVLDLGLQEVGGGSVEEIARLQKTTNFNTSVIFISSSSTFESRLQAVRAGGVGYFPKPVDIVSLVERIDSLVAGGAPKGYRVLIVDDDVAVAEYYSQVLRNSGMNVEVVTDPDQLFNVMSNFRPELLLMDVYMPLCSGVELAKMVRQDNSYLDVPIVFFSSETDLGRQLDAVKAGADDFLTKPISAEFLVSSISTRADRYRSLRSLIMRDGLTGLYNHSAIKEELGAEVLIAGRNKTDMAFAMIDLDDFKHVNDSYGHPVGDQVLRTLSRLLRQRLRRSDVIGRYGGEEFVVIFPGTSAERACKVLDEVRVAFGMLQQYSDQGPFSVSFSAGIADLGVTEVVEDLIEAADSALYQAKNSGKNRIVLASA
jgi:diguanylate cyclase (GGDEF)-like protein